MNKAPTRRSFYYHYSYKPKMLFFGHVMRADGLEKEMMLACKEGKRRRGRPRIRWMEEIMAGTGMGLEELRDVMRNRSA